MGNNWRFLTETVKQKWGLTVEKNFRPTSNARNEAMFIEATKFANYLKQFEKDLKAWQKNVEVSFGTLQNALVAPLPMAQENEPGLNVNVEPMGRAAMELNKRLETEVLKPIQQWMVAYKMIQEHMKKSEELRLILDSRRRTVDSLKGKEERYKSLLTGTQRERGEVSLRMTQHQTIHKEEKMLRDMDLFRQKEQTVYNSLFTLIKDTSVLRDYAAAAVQIMQECFMRASETFNGGAAGMYADDNPYSAPSQVLASDPNYLNIANKAHSTHSKHDQYSSGYVPNSDGNAFTDQKPHSPYSPAARSGYSQQAHSQSGMFADGHADRYPSPRY